MTRDRFNPYYRPRNTFYLTSPNLLTFYEATELYMLRSHAERSGGRDPSN